MTRFRCAAALLALVVSSGLAAAADSPLANISNDADVVIRLKSPKSTSDKLASLVDKVMPGFGAMVRQNSQQLGLLISNPTSAGVDNKKDWYVALTRAAVRVRIVSASKQLMAPKDESEPVPSTP